MLSSVSLIQVLLVEDDLVLQQVLLRWLQALGYSVTLARSIAESHEKLTTGPYDLVLLDLSLPDGSGIAVLELSSMLPEPPLVIVITADSSVSTVIEALRRGAFDYLTKPVNVDLLRRTVERASEHITYRRAAAELARLRAQDQAMQATARTIVHHLSQDLTVILGEAQLLEEDMSEAAHTSGVRRIVKAVTSAAAKLTTLRQARRFVTADSSAGDKMLDLDAAVGGGADANVRPRL